VEEGKASDARPDRYPAGRNGRTRRRRRPGSPPPRERARRDRTDLAPHPEVRRAPGPSLRTHRRPPSAPCILRQATDPSRMTAAPLKDKAWTGWRTWRGELWSPEGYHWHPEHLRALPFLLAGLWERNAEGRQRHRQKSRATATHGTKFGCYEASELPQDQEETEKSGGSEGSGGSESPEILCKGDSLRSSATAQVFGLRPHTRWGRRWFPGRGKHERAGGRRARRSFAKGTRSAAPLLRRYSGFARTLGMPPRPIRSLLDKRTPGQCPGTPKNTPSSTQGRPWGSLDRAICGLRQHTTRKPQGRP
jgi:hypothetical protein